VVELLSPSKSFTVIYILLSTDELTHTDNDKVKD